MSLYLSNLSSGVRLDKLTLSWSSRQPELLRKGRENSDEDVAMREPNRDFGRDERNRSSGANVEQGCYYCGAVGHVMRDCPRVNSSGRKSYRYESRRGEENERKNTGREEKERSRSRSKKRPRYNRDSCPVGREMSRRSTSDGKSSARSGDDKSQRNGYEGKRLRRKEYGFVKECSRRKEKSLVPYSSDSDSKTSRSNSKSRSSNHRLVHYERTADMYSNDAVDPAMKGGLTEQGEVVGVFSEDAKPENWQEPTNDEPATLPSILVQLGLADEESRESSGREDDTFVGARNSLEQRSTDTKNFDNCDGLTTERPSHSLINTKDGDISYISMVMKHYGISTSGQSRIDLSPEDYEFGSARLWPWGSIFCRRLTKGRLISLQNYARRVKQNREFGIFDKYVRSSSGWGEPGQGILFPKRKRSRKSVTSV